MRARYLVGLAAVALTAGCSALNLGGASDDFSVEARMTVHDLTQLYPAYRWGAACEEGGADGPAFVCSPAFEFSAGSPQTMADLITMADAMDARASAFTKQHWEKGLLGAVEPAFGTERGRLASPRVVCAGIAMKLDFNTLRALVRDGDSTAQRAVQDNQCSLRRWTAADGAGYFYSTNDSGFS